MTTIKKLGYRVTTDDGKMFEIVEKETTEQVMDSSEKMINEFFDRFQFVRYPMVISKPEQPLEPLRRTPTGIGLQKHLAAGIPFPLARQYRILKELTEFSIPDIGDLFSTKPDLEDQVYDRSKIIDNAYHDIKDLLDAKKIEIIEGSKPKKYRVLDRTMDGKAGNTLKKLMANKKIDLATHKEVLPH
jgi:hypothetical protein